MGSDRDCLLVLDSRTGESYRLPISEGCVNATDIGKIGKLPEDDPRSVQPLRVFDRGFENTACMESSITVIDGQKGEIRFRDRLIEDLFKEYVYEDVMHLLIWGDIPTVEQKKTVRADMCAAMNPPSAVFEVVKSFPKDAEPYNMVMAALAVISAFDADMVATRHQQRPMFHSNLDKADKAIVRTIGYMATCVALVYCHKHGKTFTPPQAHRSLIGNLLLMMGFLSENDGEDSKVETSLNKLWILYADSEITCSTASVLHAGSSLIDPTSCVMSGVICGHGPLHGGAIELAYEGFEQIGSAENVGPLLEAVKAKKARLFGYGHRVLKKRDPRAALIKEVMPVEEVHSQNPLLQIALEVDRAARKDPYFIERGLHANVDLYGSFPYLALGFEKDMVTSIIILSRFGGSLAHWRESLSQPIKLWRPQQKYRPAVPVINGHPKQDQSAVESTQASHTVNGTAEKHVSASNEVVEKMSGVLNGTTQNPVPIPAQ